MALIVEKMDLGENEELRQEPLGDKGDINREYIITYPTPTAPVTITEPLGFFSTA